MAPLFVLLAVVAAAGAIAALVYAGQARRLKRERFIRSYDYPKGLLDRFSKAHAQLAFKDVALVSRALRHFFLAHLRSGRRFVSMPSQVVDDLWHEFILYTRNYEAFCREAFGGFLHHTPAVVLGSERVANAGLRRTWWWSCREENIDPVKPSRLPLLFALDAKLDIPGGFLYTPDCKRSRSRSKDGCGGTAHCGTDFHDSSVDGCTDGFGNAGDGGGSNGGDDGSGCGGGCGGGGGGD